ncbi:hypothetical protein [Oricola indica]|jgi:hypothetical protein|uniref:hypothetical protein n=1 Tax=Oricola indica TaxID=2872591 RepID=UPI001CBD05D3|nr:hypothetical protein [Oricola indica]
MWGSKASESGYRLLKFCNGAALAVFLTLGAGSGAHAVELFELDLPAPITAIRKSADGAYIALGQETFRLVSCDRPEGVCLSTAAPEARRPKPSGALPDGGMDVAEDGDIRRAWYGAPTNRYAHGVLGDATEGGALIAIDESGREIRFDLPESQVFEDLTPRIHDLDGDGSNEVVTIRSSKTGGSAVAIYGLRDGQLVELGASSENGRPNRWLNIAGIVPDGSGAATLYAVRTPHIGGRLFSLAYANDTITEKNDIAGDVSNHVIGSRDLGLSAVSDFDGDGNPDLVLPSQDRMRLRFPLSNLPDIALPGPIDRSIAVVGGRIVTVTQDDRLLVVAP